MLRSRGRRVNRSETGGRKDAELVDNVKWNALCVLLSVLRHPSHRRWHSLIASGPSVLELASSSARPPPYSHPSLGTRPDCWRRPCTRVEARRRSICHTGHPLAYRQALTLTLPVVRSTAFSCSPTLLTLKLPRRRVDRRGHGANIQGVYLAQDNP